MLAAFIKEGAPDAAALVARIDRLVRDHPGLSAFVVFLSGPEKRADLENLAKERRVTVPLALAPPKLPAEMQRLCRLDPSAANTLFLYRWKTVRFNAVNVRANAFEAVDAAAKAMVAEPQR